MLSQNSVHQTMKSSWKFVTKLEDLLSLGKRCHVIFPSGIELVFLDFVSNSPCSHVFSIDKAPIEFSFHLAGFGQAVLHHSLQQQETITVSSDSAILSFCPQSQWKTQVFDKQSYRILNIYIPPEVFWEKFDNDMDQIPRDLRMMITSGRDHPYNQVIPMSCHLKTLVLQLFHCPYQGALQQLYLEAKSMEIIVRHIWEISRAPVRDVCRMLRPCEREQIYAARDLLLHDLSSPPSLEKLTRAVGLNPNKLNQGFRKEFGMTVFAYYRMVRMQRSRELLDQGRLNIDETAQELGFYDTPHFIRHFKHHFGQTPGMYLKYSGPME